MRGTTPDDLPGRGCRVLEVLMGERTLRGARLGGQSFEDERGIEFAARQQVGYRCAHGHEFEITMSVEADVPALWECPRCGAEGRATSGIEPEVKDVKPARTHWDMLLERRSIKELEDILTERLELLRGGEIGPAHLHRASARKKRAAAAPGATRRRPRPGPPRCRGHLARGVVASRGCRRRPAAGSAARWGSSL